MGLFSKKPKNPIDKVLETIHTSLTVKNEIRDGKVFVPLWNVTIAPSFQQTDSDQMAVIDFHITCPDWDGRMYECCASGGKDFDTALGLAIGSFTLCFLPTFTAMMKGENAEPFESEFIGKTHRWKLYTSDVVGFGDNMGVRNYFDLIADGVRNRLGNQRLAYVKVFASKGVNANGESNLTGEVRINDFAIPELGKLVEENAAKWNVARGSFSSAKQFFFLKQESETVVPYPFGGEKREPTLLVCVKKTLDLILELDTSKNLSVIKGQLEQFTGDRTTAEELFSFLPEICAERLLTQQMDFDEQILFSKGSDNYTVYKSQLADYYTLGDMMFYLFSTGVYGERTDELVQKLVGYSASYNSLCKAIEGGFNSDSGELYSKVMFNVPEDFEIR